MDLENQTKELTNKYNKCKFLVVKWESAFMKEKGRQPARDDLISAPPEIHVAYTNYIKIKQILSKIDAQNVGYPSPSRCSDVRGQRVVPSPNRIFGGRRAPGSAHRKSTQPFYASPRPATKSRPAGFCKLTSRLYVDKPEATAPDVLVEEEEDLGMENILNDVQRALETFDKDKDDFLLVDSPKFEFNLGKTKSSNSPYVPLNLEERLDKHTIFSGIRSRQLREIDPGWLERCVAEIKDSSEVDTEDCSTSEAILDKIAETNLPIEPTPFVVNAEAKEQTVPLPNSIKGAQVKQSRIAVEIQGREETNEVTRVRTRAEVKGKSKNSKHTNTKALMQMKSEMKSSNKVSTTSKRKAATMSDEYEFLDDASSGLQMRKKRVKLTAREVTERKISSGTGNENFIRIDVSKKRFVRGKRKMTGIQHKRNNWKLKKRQESAEEKIKLVKCRKCGGVGHFARFCIKQMLGKDAEEPDDDEVDDSPFPTLEEAARMFQTRHVADAFLNRTCVYSNDESSKGEANGSLSQMADSVQSQDWSASKELEDEVRLVLVSHDDDDLPDQVSSMRLATSNEGRTSASARPISVQPVLSPQSSVLSEKDEEMLTQSLELFGYNEFRSGQKEAITRVLRGQSTLVVLSTGSGKSLCYLLPAYLYAQKHPGAITICVSPLVSLMEDQAQSIPSFLAGACLHSNMTVKQREIVLEKIRNKKLSVLLVSPEAVCGGMLGLLRNVDEFPPVAFACVDEVHCVSEWSHNFRPTYLRLCKILRERLNVQTILGLTATATTHTMNSVCSHLCINPSTVVRGEVVPANLRLSCSRDLDREEALLVLLRSDRFIECNSIIIYCTRREQCERIATLIRTVLKDKTSGLLNANSRRKISTECETYHAGMSAARRKSVQNNFMSGRIRIVVATVAFGMGIDKSDIRAVIHFNMPKTFESYIQEIGRAGRDGLPAECHMFLDSSKGKDICELRRHIYSNSVDRATLRKFLSLIFKPCACHLKKENPKEPSNQDEEVDTIQCPGHEISFSVEKTVHDLDLPDENVETLLCYLENYEQKSIDLLPKCYHMCSIQSYGGTKLLKMAAKKCPPLAAAIALQKEKRKFQDSDTHVEFNFIEVAATLDWNSGQVRKELKGLEWTGTQFDEAGNPIKFRKSGILVEFSDLAYRMIAPGALSDEESDSMLNFLHARNFNQERLEVFQLHRVYQSLFSNSCKTVESVCESFDEEKSDNLKKLILDYFNESEVGVPSDWKPPLTATDAEKEETIRQDVRNLLNSHGDDHDFTSRSIAKIFLGISSPCFSSENWCRNKSFWRKHLDVDFHFLCQLAAEEIN